MPIPEYVAYMPQLNLIYAVCFNTREIVKNVFENIHSKVNFDIQSTELFQGRLLKISPGTKNYFSILPRLLQRYFFYSRRVNISFPCYGTKTNLHKDFNECVGS